MKTIREDRSRSCPQCGKSFTVKFPSSRKRFCSLSCAGKQSSRKTGADNHKYKGGKSSHPLYDTYNEMIARCTRASHKRFKDYGGRGITVCERWREDFWNFVADMGSRPDGQSLDRIDNDGNYEPDNCKWSTNVEQRNNSRARTQGPGRNSKTGRFQ